MPKSGQSPYLEAVFKFRDLEKKMKPRMTPTPKSRVLVLEFWPNQVKPEARGTAKDLVKYLQGPPSDECKHRLYLVEDLDKDVIEALGSHFGIEPYLFAAQSCDTFRGSGLPRKLVSMQSSTEQYTLTYLDVNELKGRAVFNPLLFTDAGVYRRTFFDKLHHDNVFYIQRNASFWKASMEGGWNAIILLEPEAKFIDGYIDFNPYSSLYTQVQSRDETNGPPKRSMLDDIELHWTELATPSDIRNTLSDPDECASCLKRIVADKWNVALDYLGERLSKLQEMLWEFEESRDRQNPFGPLKEMIKLASEWRRKVSRFIEGVQWSLETLGIDRGQSQVQTAQGYVLILQRLQDLKAELDSVVTSVTGILGTIQGELSLEVAERSKKEAELSRKLTFIALFFVPLAYSTSLFSMGGDFLPGSRLFGVYFAVAIPLTLLTLLVFRLLALDAASGFISSLLGQRGEERREDTASNHH